MANSIDKERKFVTNQIIAGNRSFAKTVDGKVIAQLVTKSSSGSGSDTLLSNLAQLVPSHVLSAVRQLQSQGAAAHSDAYRVLLAYQLSETFGESKAITPLTDSLLDEVIEMMNRDEDLKAKIAQAGAHLITLAANSE
jgi:hypothetical protein